MKSWVPKVLQTVGGRAMIIHVLDTVKQLQPAGIHVVYNPGMPEVQQACSDFDITWAAQAEQLGTGHAVQQAMPGIPEKADVLVMYGDIPLIEADVLKTLHGPSSDGIKVLTMEVDDPKGYGRIVRDKHDAVTGIVEERDASDAQKSITEVNSGIIMAPKSTLMSCLEHMVSDNSQNEYYLTDVFSIAYQQGIPTSGVVAPASLNFESTEPKRATRSPKLRITILSAEIPFDISQDFIAAVRCSERI